MFSLYRVLVGTAGLTALLASPLVAQTPTPNPSRPSLTNSPDLGPAGYLEIELGGTISSTSGPTSWNTPFQASYTVSESWEFRLGTDGYASTAGSGAGVHAPHNATMWVQWLPLQAGGDELHIALELGADIPITGGIFRHVNKWNETAMVAISRTILGLGWQSNIVLTCSNGHDGFPYSYGVTSLVTTTLGGRWTPFIDFALMFEREQAVLPYHNAMAGIGFSLTQRIVLDAAYGVGFAGNSGCANLQFGASILP